MNLKFINGKLIFLLISIFSLLPTLVQSVHLYTVIGRGDRGDIIVRARKTYNIWDNGPNRTYYDVEIFSPYIKNSNQEIRVAFQWKWRDPDRYQGYFQERAIFYGSVRSGQFTQYRLDRNIETDGSFLFTNYQATSFPKTYPYLTQDRAATEDLQYHLVQANVSEINVYTGQANFTFYVDRDEP